MRYNMLANISLPSLFTKKTYFITSINLINILLIFSVNTSVQAAELNSKLEENVTNELLVAEFSANNNQIEKALAIYQKLALKTNNPKLAKRATELAISLGDDLQALKTAPIWANSDKTSTKAQLITTLLSMQYKTVNDARNYIKQLLEISTTAEINNIELIINIAQKPGTMEQLQNLLNELKVDLKDNFNLYLALAMSYEKTTDIKHSLESINTVLELKPDWSNAHIYKAKLLNLYKSADSATTYIANTLSKMPNLVELRKTYATILFDQEKLQKAAEQYEILSKNDAYRDESLLQLAHISMSSNNYKEAKKHLLALTDSRNYKELAFYYLGLIAQQQNDDTTALIYFKKITSGEYLIRSKIRESIILTKQHNDKKSQEILNSIYNAKIPELQQLYQPTKNKAQGPSASSINPLIGSGNNSNIEELIKKSYIKELILSEAQILYEQKLFENTLILLKNLQSVYPEDYELVYSIGFLAKKMNNFELFEKNMLLVIKANPENYKALHSLGWYYFINNQDKKALELLQKAYDANGDRDTIIGARLGAVLWQLGNRDQAKKIWQKMLKLDPQNKELHATILKYQKK